MLSRIKSMKLSDYIEIKRPDYVYLSLTPDSSTRNYNSDQLAMMVVSFYKSLYDRVFKIEKKFFVYTNVKCSYIISMQKSSIEFYLLVPSRYVDLAKEKLYAIWPKIKIEVTNKEWKLRECTVNYQLYYKYLDFLSLSTDSRANSLLNAILNTTEILTDDSMNIVCFNFIPLNQNSWVHEYRAGASKLNNGQPVEKDVKNAWIIVKYIVWGICVFIEEILNGLTQFTLGQSREVTTKDSLLYKHINNYRFESLSVSSRKKINQSVIGTQIIVSCSADKKTTAVVNATSLCQSFYSVAEDNMLLYKKLRHSVDYKDYSIANSTINTFSVTEARSLLQLPGRELLDRYTAINCIKYLERKVPEELTKGRISLGINKCKDVLTKATLSADKNKYNLGTVYVGPMGCGKTTLMINNALDAIKANESVVVVEFIKNCEICTTLETLVPKDKLCVIDLSNESQLQSFGFNEVIHLYRTEDPACVVESANWQSQAVAQFINAINPDKELTGKMRRGLIAVCNVVFTFKNTSLKNVVDCLLSHEMRELYINNLGSEYKVLLEEDIINMRDLDTVEKDGEIDTNSKKTEYTIDRINLLMEDMRLRKMFKKPVEENLDFVDMLDKGKVILIKIPEHTFPTKLHKNLLTTFYMQKIWIACQIRGKYNSEPRRTHFFIDEIVQAPTAQLTISSELYQSRKFQLRFCLSVHGLNQCKTLIEPFEECGINYMLLTGTDENSFNKLAKKLDPFTYADFIKLERYSSLNLIEYEKGYATFVTKLPGVPTKNIL